MVTQPLDPVAADPAVRHGQARIRGTRIPVNVVLDCLATDMTEGQIHAEYSSLPPDAVTAARVHAATLAVEKSHHPLDHVVLR